MVGPKGQKTLDTAPVAGPADRADPTQDRPAEISPPIEPANFALVVSEAEDTLPDDPLRAGWDHLIDGTTEAAGLQHSAESRWPDRLAGNRGDGCLEDPLSTKRETQSLEDVVNAQDGSWTG